MRLATCLALLASAAFAQAPAEKLLTKEQLLAHTRYLASDGLEGRGPATRGDALAQGYIAAQLESLGVQPGAPDGGWLQPVELVGITGNPKTLELSGNGKALSLKYWDDIIAVSGTPTETTKVEGAEVVFVGYGIQAPEYQWDDFKGLDVKGKVLLVMNNDPESDPALFAGKTRLWYGRWDYKYDKAMRLGAAGCVIIHTKDSAAYPWQVVQTSWSGEQFDLPPAPGAPSMPLRAWATEDASRRLVALAGKDLDALRAAAQSRDFKPVPLGVKLSTSFKNVVQTKRTANVLGVIKGSDPKLSQEWVVITAHHDHLGKNDAAKAGEDAIFNGAVDNASGVATLLTLARGLTGLPKAPRRSILLAAVAAEEQGLLGSQFLVDHPPMPHARMALDLNVDGINIWGKTRDVSVIGLGKSSVDLVISKLAKAQGRVVKPDQRSDRGFFYRSDQFNFARAGVPSAYFSSGNDYVGKPVEWGQQQRDQWEEKHYHQPSDEVEASWNLDGAVDDLLLYFRLTVEVANAPAMPTWNKGDEFEAARLESLKVGAQR
ncbi:MAG: M28 family peptidase [Myxococcaceae bacterium]|nr:M28 family peptidase [Myxococcaceae bacterium]